MLNEVLVYNIVDDLWVLFLGKVYNLIFLCEKYKGKNFICIFCKEKNRFSICMLCQLSFIDILQVVVDIIFEEFMYFFSVFFMNNN